MVAFQPFSLLDFGDCVGVGNTTWYFWSIDCWLFRKGCWSGRILHNPGFYFFFLKVFRLFLTSFLHTGYSYCIPLLPSYYRRGHLYLPPRLGKKTWPNYCFQLSLNSLCNCWVECLFDQFIVGYLLRCQRELALFCYSFVFLRGLAIVGADVEDYSWWTVSFVCWVSFPTHFLFIFFLFIIFFSFLVSTFHDAAICHFFCCFWKNITFYSYFVRHDGVFSRS